MALGRGSMVASTSARGRPRPRRSAAAEPAEQRAGGGAAGDKARPEGSGRRCSGRPYDLEAYSDGSVDANGRAGWGVCVLARQPVLGGGVAVRAGSARWEVLESRGGCGGARGATLARDAELHALCEALDAALSAGLVPRAVELVADARYVLGAAEGFAGTGGDVRGADARCAISRRDGNLWRRLDRGLRRAEERGVRVNFRWVRGHSGVFGNERADALAAPGSATWEAPPYVAPDEDASARPARPPPRRPRKEAARRLAELGRARDEAEHAARLAPAAGVLRAAGRLRPGDRVSAGALLAHLRDVGAAEADELPPGKLKAASIDEVFGRYLARVGPEAAEAEAAAARRARC